MTMPDHRPKLTKTQREELRRRVRAGEPRKTLAQEFEVSYSTVVHHSKCTSVDHSKRVEAVRRYENGELAKDLAAEYGVHEITVRVWVSRYKKFALPAKIRNQASAIRKHWMTAAQAAECLKLDKSWLCSQLRSGRFPGAFLMGAGAQGVWLIPRCSVEAYRK